jgi:DedD protein
LHLPWRVALAKAWIETWEFLVRKKSLEEGELSGIRRKLIGRMIFAVLMIVALLGGLALFDHFNSLRDEEDEEEAAAWVPTPSPPPSRRPAPPVEAPPTLPAPTETPPSAPVDALPVPVPLEAPIPLPPGETPVPETVKSEKPETRSTPPVSSPGKTDAPKREGDAAPSLAGPKAPETKEVRPGTPRVADSPRGRPTIRPAPPPVVEGSAAPVDRAIPKDDTPPGPEIPPQPVLPPSRARASDVPPTRGESRPQVGAQAITPSSRLYSGFALQAGVFADPRRAEELHARLTLEGIPSTIEARVHVGPFRNKAEMAEAQAKLKALGIDAVVLTPRGRR